MAERKKVSEQIAKALDQISSIDSIYTNEENKRAIQTAEHLGFTSSRCTWWGGCYYCNDGNGWYLVYCIS